MGSPSFCVCFFFKEILVCSVCLFPWCKYSHHSLFQAINVASLNVELGRDAHYSLLRASRSRFQLTTAPSVPSRIKIQLPAVITGLIACLLFASHPTSQLCHFPINYLHLNPGLRVCFWGNPNQDPIFGLFYFYSLSTCWNM